jgi:2',3'-cyclic-nucleotide 2'-phosphodiesterase / 3'-nucleotidase
MQNKLSIKVIILITIWLLAASCTNSRPDSITIKIIETSDVHGQIFPYDFLNDRPANHSLAQVAAFVKDERKKDKQTVVLLENGDFIQGDPTMYYYNFIDTNGVHFAAKVMNFMQYDAATLGNHDIEAGPKVYNKLVDDSKFPWLAANIIRTKTGAPYFAPYTIVEKEGIKIAVLGLITPSIPNWLPESLWPEMEFQDMIESATNWVEIIQTKEKPDLLIGLFHAGVDYTYSNQTAETPKNENASELVATQVPGFDVVFVGHDHRGWNKNITNVAGENVLILGTTSKARDVAVATIHLTKNEHNKYDRIIAGDLVKIESYVPDADFMQQFTVNMEVVKAYSSQPVANITSTITSVDALFGDAAFTDLIHQAQLEITGAQVSLAAPFSLNNQLKAGQLRVRDMFQLYRFENLIYTMTLTGREITDHLEYSYELWINTMKDADDNMLKLRKDESGDITISNGRARLENPIYNFDNAEGIIYSVDLTKPFSGRVSVVSLNDGSLFDPDENYLVAVNSYRGNGGGNHLTDGAGIQKADLKQRVVTTSELDFRYYLMEWLREREVMQPEVNHNWKFIPENWIENAAAKDRELLFGRQ